MAEIWVRGAGRGGVLATYELLHQERPEDLVTLIGRAAGIEVRAAGKAMADGGRGSRVRVQNSNSKRIVEVTVTAPGVVELEAFPPSCNAVLKFP